MIPCRNHYRYLLWEPTPSELEGFERNPDSYVPDWTPNLGIANEKEQILHEECKGGKENIYHIMKPGDSNVWGEICEFPPGIQALFGYAHEITPRCSQIFDLKCFPFDVQNLSLILECDMLSKYVRVKPNCVGFSGDPPATVIQEDYKSTPEWELVEPVVECCPSPWGSDQMVISFKAKRQWQKHILPGQQ